MDEQQRDEHIRQIDRLIDITDHRLDSSGDWMAHEVQPLYAALVSLRAQLARERQRVERCEKVLQFYADEQTYEDHGHWFGHGPDQVWMPMVPAEQDRGARARAALTATPEEAMGYEPV